MTTRLAHPAHVLAAYLEPILVGRRVVVLGDATVGLAEELADRGARLVHAYDTDASRVAEAIARGGSSKSPAFAVFTADLGVRDGAFDVVVIPDLGMFLDPADVLLRARRLVGVGGVAVVSTPNASVTRRLAPGGGQAASKLGYYELYDAVSLQFTRVRMLGQAPFVGYTVADFAPDGDPDVSVDTSLLEASEEPEAFLAIASDQAVALDAYAVVGLPFAAVAEELGSEPEVDTIRGQDRLALTEAQTRLALVDAELETMRTRARDHARALDARATQEAALAARAIELEAELELAAGRAQASEARATAVIQQIRDLEGELRHQRESNVALAKSLEDEKRGRSSAERDLGSARAKPVPAAAKVEIDALTQDLDTAQARISELEFDGARTIRPAALATGMVELEASLAHARRASTSSETARALAETHAKSLAGDLEKARAHAASADLRMKAEADRRAAAEAANAVREAEIADLKKQLAAARQRIEQGAAEASAKLSDASRRIAEGEARIAALTEEVAQLERARTKAPPAAEPTGFAADVSALERALAERGRRIRALERDLHETERVGRELLDELAEAPVPAPAAPSPPPTTTGSSGSRANGGLAAPALGSTLAPADAGGAAAAGSLHATLDELAAKAARTEADLTAASWRIAQLERELHAATTGARPDETVHAELEQALIAARAEVASLRKALHP